MCGVLSTKEIYFMNTFKNDFGTLHEEHKHFQIRYCKCRQYSKFLVFAPSIVATRGTLFSKANYWLNIEIVSMGRSTEFLHS